MPLQAVGTPLLSPSRHQPNDRFAAAFGEIFRIEFRPRKPLWKADRAGSSIGES
jgi:hypothetical protein